MKGKNKKTKKVVKKAVRRQVKKVKPTAKRKAAKKKSESVYGASLPVNELGTRVFVKQEDFVAQEPVNVLETEEKINLAEPEALFSEDFDSEQDLSDVEVNPDPLKPKEMSNNTKTIIMYVSVASIMAVIVFFWALSVKYSLSQNIQDAADIQPNSEMEEIKASLGGLKDNFFAVSDYAKTQIDQTIKTEMNKDTANTDPQIPDDITKQLKEKLENLNTNSANTNNINNQ